MRSMQTSFLLVSSALLVAACSSSGGSGSKAQTVADEAKGTQFSQAVLDDLKAKQIQSEAVLPDSDILSGTDETKKAKSKSKLNADGLSQNRVKVTSVA